MNFLNAKLMYWVALLVVLMLLLFGCATTKTPIWGVEGNSNMSKEDTLKIYTPTKEEAAKHFTKAREFFAAGNFGLADYYLCLAVDGNRDLTKDSDFQKLSKAIARKNIKGGE